jgi:hypothetical protein
MASTDFTDNNFDLPLDGTLESFAKCLNIV